MLVDEMGGEPEQLFAQIDDAYRTKYRRLPQYVAPMLIAEVRSTTIKLVPRSIS